MIKIQNPTEAEIKGFVFEGKAVNIPAGAIEEVEDEIVPVLLKTYEFLTFATEVVSKETKKAEAKIAEVVAEVKEVKKETKEAEVKEAEVKEAVVKEAEVAKK